MDRSRLSSFATALALLGAPALAAAQSSGSLPGVVVTAARTPQPAGQVLADVRVIDSAQIERAGTMTFTELLQTHGGVEITANGGPGQVSGVFVRGSNPNHVVLLIDGVRINSATTGANAFEHIPLAQIERIEILRAPASSLYGADAIGGVIQVFTRQGGTRTNAHLGAGTWRTRDASVGLGREFGNTRLSLQAGWRGSRAFSATNEANTFSFDPDDDGHRNRNLGLALSHEWAAGQAVVLRALHSDSRTHFDAGPGTDDVSNQQLSSFALESRNRIRADWHSTLRIAQGSDHLDTEGAFPGSFDTDQHQLSWQNDLAAFGGQLVAGIEWRREKVGGSTAYSSTRRDISSLFGGWSAAIDAHLLQASLRHDRNSQFGGRSTGNIAYGYSLTPAWRVSAGAGTAFHAPSFNDLYFPLSFGFSGNPALRPERSKSAELAARYEHDGSSAGLVVFENRIDDLIAVDPTFSTVINVNRARIRGTTLSAGHTGSVWYARAEWTQQRAVDADSGTQLVRRARTHGSLGGGASFGAWRFGADIVASGARFDSVANTPGSRMAAYELLHLHGAYAVNREWSIRARVNNVADKRYELAQGYNTPRRNLFVALEFASQ